jgi:hypothetical protein
LSFLNLNSVLANRYGFSNGLFTKSQQYNLPLSQTMSTQGVLPTTLFGLNLSLPTTTPYLNFLEVMRGDFHQISFFDLKNLSSFSFYSTPNLKSLGLISFIQGVTETFTIPGNFSEVNTKVTSSLSTLRNTLLTELNWYFLFFNLTDGKLNFSLPFLYTKVANVGQLQDSLTYVTNNFSTESLENQHILGKQETSANYRFQRLQNPVFKYDFKLGNYMPDENKVKSPFLYTTIHDLTTGVRKAN